MVLIFDLDHVWSYVNLYIVLIKYNAKEHKFKLIIPIVYFSHSLSISVLYISQDTVRMIIENMTK